MARSAEIEDEYKTKNLKRELLWMYIPNWENQGAIESIPTVKTRDDEKYIYGDYYWQETKECAGFVVTDACPHRFEEMSLISYTPYECL